jgi:hypothetical protein
MFSACASGARRWTRVCPAGVARGPWLPTAFTCGKPGNTGSLRAVALTETKPQRTFFRTVYTKWILLAGAILSEVTASLSLKAALDNPAFFVVVVLGYSASFSFLAAVLRKGLGLGVRLRHLGCTGSDTDGAAGRPHHW